MPHWRIKSLLQRCIGRIPYPHYWNELFQRWMTRTLTLTDERLITRLNHCRDHLDAYRSYATSTRPDFSAFDLGTGWFPVVPLGLFLCGAREVYTCDIVPLMNSSRLQQTFDGLIRLADRGTLQNLLPVLPDRLDRLRQVAQNRSKKPPIERLDPFRIRPLVQDAACLALPDRSMDLVVSVDCINHIPSPALRSILAEFHRILALDGIMTHHIELADLYWYFDRSITPFHYQQYTDEEWSRLDNPITPQSRLRLSEYRSHFREAGFVIAHEENKQGDAEQLARIPLAPRFQSSSPEDQLTIRSRCILRPACP